MAGMYSLDNQKMKIKKALDAAGVALKKKKKKALDEKVTFVHI